MHPTLDSGRETQLAEEALGERIEALAGWIQELDAQIRATMAAGDEKTLKELRRALEAWSKRDPKFEERLTERVDVLADRLATLSSTVNTTASAHAGADGELASLRRELEQETAKLRATMRDRGPAADAAAIEELRHAIANLSADRSSNRSDKDVGGLQERVDNIGGRVDTLAKTVASTAAGLAGREGELATLRRALDEANAQIDELVASLRRDAGHSDEAANLREQLDALAQKVATGTTVLAERDRVLASLASHVQQDGAKVEALARELREAEEHLASQVGSLDARLQPRLGELERKLEAASASLSGKELELAAVRRQLEETGARVEAAVREVREELPEAASRAELEERLAPLQVQVEGLASRLQEWDTLAQERLARESSRLSELERRVGDADRRLAELDSLARGIAEVTPSEELEKRLTALQRELHETDARLGETVRDLQDALAALPDPSVAELEARLEAQVEPLVGRVETLARRLEETERVAKDERAGEGARLDEIDDHVATSTRRLDALEREVEGTAAEMARTTGARSEEQTWVREQLDALVQAVSETPAKADLEEPLNALSTRLEELERERTRLAAEMARAAGESAAEREALAARLEELAELQAPIPPSQDKELKRLLLAFADRIEAMEMERAADRERGRASDGEVGDLQAALEGFETRLASAEQFIEGTDLHELETRIDGLTSRLASLEETAKAPRPVAAPAPGDGRFRVELRALELRMQHAEAAARENREAVLVQLERLAARLEWRLQRLESEFASETQSPAAPEPLGQVVPIRGGADT